MSVRFASISAVAAALALASCGDDETASSPAAYIPADTPIYLEASIEPGEQIDSATALLERVGEVPLIGSTLDAQTLIDEIEASAAEEGVEFSFAEDVEPWLGDRAGFAVNAVDPQTDDAEAVVAIEVTDEDVARESFERVLFGEAELEEVDLAGVKAQRPAGEEGAFAFLDGFLLFATTDAGFEAAVEAHDGDSLAEAEEFEGAFDELPAERLASAYLDFGFFLELAATEDDAAESEIAAARAVLGDLFESPIAATLTAQEDSVALDYSLPSYPLGRLYSASDLLAEAPADAVAAVGSDEVGSQVEGLVGAVQEVAASDEGITTEEFIEMFEGEVGVSLEEIAAALGDGVVSVRGDLKNEFVVDARLVVNDEQAATTLLDALRTSIESEPQNVIGPALGTGDGFSVVDRAAGSAGIGFGSFEVEGDRARALLATSEAVARKGQSDATLEESELFGRGVDALGDDVEPVAFADLGPILDAAVGDASFFDTAIGAATAEEAAASFLADKLSYAALGENPQEDRLIQRLVIGLAE